MTNKVIHPDDAEMFTDQTDLEALRSAVFSTQQPEAYRFRKNVSGQFVWITMEFLPCRNCCAQNPWATVWCVRMHRPTSSARSWTSPTATTP